MEYIYFMTVAVWNLHKAVLAIIIIIIIYSSTFFIILSTNITVSYKTQHFPGWCFLKIHLFPQVWAIL